jgi:hypothetical protein
VAGSALGFELEDQPWFPRRLRRMMMEYIGFLANGLGSYRGLAPILAEALERQGASTVLDLASGSGAPIVGLKSAPELATGVHFILSDLHPIDGVAPPAGVHWHPRPLEAVGQAAEVHLEAVRTLLNGYHHFSEVDKGRLIAQHGPRGILVAEILTPSVGALVRVLLATTVGQVLLAPFVRPFRWERLFWTWVVPVNLLTVTFDGMMSVLRVDPPARLVARARAHAPMGTEVRHGQCGPWWAPVHWVFVGPAGRGG